MLFINLSSARLARQEEGDLSEITPSSVLEGTALLPSPVEDSYKFTRLVKAAHKGSFNVLTTTVHKYFSLWPHAKRTLWIASQSD